YDYSGQFLHPPGDPLPQNAPSAPSGVTHPNSQGIYGSLETNRLHSPGRHPDRSVLSGGNITLHYATVNLQEGALMLGNHVFPRSRPLLNQNSYNNQGLAIVNEIAAFSTAVEENELSQTTSVDVPPTQIKDSPPHLQSASPREQPSKHCALSLIQPEPNPPATLFMCAAVAIFHPDDPSQHIKALASLDSGFNRSYIIKEVANALNLSL
ncbi:hypothetical protein KIN20_026336, partial [Parelaphostrongylus tenuis]